jgi:hypothetical protein
MTTGSYRHCISKLAHFCDFRSKAVKAQTMQAAFIRSLCGDELGLDRAIQSFCTLDYPNIQILISVSKKLDPTVSIERYFRSLIARLIHRLVLGPQSSQGSDRITEISVPASVCQ